MDGGSIAGTLFLIFLILKLAGTITWSWWWVFAPIWIDALLTLGLIALVAAGAIGGFGLIRRRNRNRELPDISMKWLS